MKTIDPSVTVGQLVAEQPNRSRLFEELSIDYCCGGKQPLQEACGARGIDLDKVLARLETLPRPGTATTEADFTNMPLEELADNIENTHHDYLRRELPRLSGMVTKVADVHGEKDARLSDLAGVFAGFCEEISNHMMKEERILFPAIRMLAAGETQTGFCFSTIAMPIGVMEAEHQQAGDALGRMRELTDGFTAPEWACNTYRALLDGLRELEQDMHQHIHKENNVLFPRALALEASNITAG